MKPAYYFFCSVMGILGILFAALLQYKAQRNKARETNVTFSAKIFWDEDWINIAMAALGVIVADILLPFAFLFLKGKYPTYGAGILEALFFPLGYMGADWLLKGVSVANESVNRAIGYKASEYDKITGNTGAPTPITRKDGTVLGAKPVQPDDGTGTN